MFWQMMPLPSLIGIVRETTYVTCIKKKKQTKTSDTSTQTSLFNCKLCTANTDDNF